MSEVTLFKDNPLVNSELFNEMQELNDKLGAKTLGTNRRISVKGSKFREIVNGEQINVSNEDTMNIIIIDCAPVARTYYEGDFDAENPTPPACWSADTDAPDSDVPEPQASRCADCPQNIKGSGQGQTRACRYSQRLAVAIEGDMDKVYQLQIAATSIFGEAKENAMPMQGYARYLAAHNTPVISVVTEMRFDEDASVPKLFFRPIRPLEQVEFEKAVELRDHEDTMKAITFKVFQTDHVEDDKPEAASPKPKAKPKAKAKPKLVEKKAEEPVEEPVKVEKKQAPQAEEPVEDLAALIDDWDD